MTKMTQWEKDSSQQIDAAGDGHVSKGKWQQEGEKVLRLPSSAIQFLEGNKRNHVKDLKPI